MPGLVGRSRDAPSYRDVGRDAEALGRSRDAPSYGDVGRDAEALGRSRVGLILKKNMAGDSVGTLV